MITVINNKTLFESNADVIVNTVNCVGVMGIGIAKTCKEMFPEMFLEYKKLCDNNQMKIGKLWFYDKSSPKILCFPTKLHWKNPSQYKYIESGLKDFVKIYEELNINNIAFPMLGCGHGGLNKDIVKNIIFEYLDKLDIDVELYTI